METTLTGVILSWSTNCLLIDRLIGFRCACVQNTAILFWQNPGATGTITTSFFGGGKQVGVSTWVDIFVIITGDENIVIA